MRKEFVAILAGGAILLTGASAQGIGIGAKFKAKKVQGNFVPAHRPNDTGPGTGDDEADSPAFLDVAVARGTCKFTSGQFKAQVGKDVAVKMKGVSCGGTPYTGNLCAHTKILATIANEEIDKAGGSTAASCPAGIAGDIAGQMNFVTGNIGTIACSAGTCSGTLAVVTDDPCPTVDKIAELRRIEVFDGPHLASIAVLGQNLKACCGPGQTTVGAAVVSGTAPCNSAPGNAQDVFAEMGTTVQGATP